VSELEDLRAALAALSARVEMLEDQVALGQLVASYGPAVDSGSSRRAAQLWSDDGVFDVPPIARWQGHDEIAGMVEGEGHQGLIANGVGHVLTAPRVVVDGDEARGWNYALNIRWDPTEERFWVARVSANEWTWRRETSGWRTVSRVNVNLDGTQPPRELFSHAAGAP